MKAVELADSQKGSWRNILIATVTAPIFRAMQKNGPGKTPSRFLATMKILSYPYHPSRRKD